MHRPLRSISTVLSEIDYYLLLVKLWIFTGFYFDLQYIHTWKMCLCYLKYIVVNLIKDFWAETISVVNWSRLVSLLFRLLLDTTTTLSYVSSWNVRMKWSVMKIENAKPPFIVILSTFIYTYIIINVIYRHTCKFQCNDSTVLRRNLFFNLWIGNGNRPNKHNNKYASRHHTLDHLFRHI